MKKCLEKTLIPWLHLESGVKKLFVIEVLELVFDTSHHDDDDDDDDGFLTNINSASNK
jgi:hypothetical protein